MLHSLLQRGPQARRPLKFPVLEPVWWKARPGSEVIGGETQRPQSTDGRQAGAGSVPSSEMGVFLYF